MHFFFKSRKLACTDIQGHQGSLISHQLRDVAGFAAQPRAGIQNRFARLRIQQQRNQLGGFILHLKPAPLKRNELRYGGGGVYETDRVRL